MILVRIIIIKLIYFCFNMNKDIQSGWVILCFFLLHWYMDVLGATKTVLYNPIHCFVEILKQLPQQIITFYVLKHDWKHIIMKHFFLLHKNVVSSVIGFLDNKKKIENFNVLLHLMNRLIFMNIFWIFHVLLS